MGFVQADQLLDFLFQKLATTFLNLEILDEFPSFLFVLLPVVLMLFLLCEQLNFERIVLEFLLFLLNFLHLKEHHLLLDLKFLLFNRVEFSWGTLI